MKRQVIIAGLDDGVKYSEIDECCDCCYIEEDEVWGDDLCSLSGEVLCAGGADGGFIAIPETCPFPRVDYSIKVRVLRCFPDILDTELQEIIQHTERKVASKLADGSVSTGESNGQCGEKQ